MAMHRRRSPLFHLAAAFVCVLVLASAPAAQAPARPYRILISNDDGVRAPGILALAQALQTLGEITIAAPAENQSGKGHSITTSDPIFVEAVTLPGGLPAFSIVAPPATCVKVGVRMLMKERPISSSPGSSRIQPGMFTYVSAPSARRARRR